MPPTGIPRPMASALDAIDLILTVLDADPSTTLAALVDHPAGGGTVVVVDGGDPGPAGVEQLAAIVAGAVRPGARLVLVSVRDSGGDTPREADLAGWRRLVGRARSGTVVLLDWFVVTDDAILSLAELAGPPPRWRG